MDVDELKQKMRKEKESHKLTRDMVLSSGSTLLNLACSGKVHYAFKKGHYYWLVGDSTSGKTFLSLTCLAEAATSKHFSDYRFIFDAPEDGALMDMERFFGKEMANRLEPPAKDEDGDPLYSRYAEEFYYNVDDALEDGRPFIYILDSMDALETLPDQDKFQEKKKAHRKGKEAAGTYGMDKARINSGNIRSITSRLGQSQSILIIISQTRESPEKFGFDKKTVAGGRSLKFYATLELWSSVKGQIEKVVRGKKRQLGIICKVKVKKNRLNGRVRSVEIPIYHSYGFDDIGACINYLGEEGHWTVNGTKVTAPEFDYRGSIEKLIQKIEEEELERELRNIVGQVWNEIEEACVIPRKKRYD